MSAFALPEKLDRLGREALVLSLPVLSEYIRSVK